jgi:hypothetical protein
MQDGLIACRIQLKHGATTVFIAIRITTVKRRTIDISGVVPDHTAVGTCAIRSPFKGTKNSQLAVRIQFENGSTTTGKLIATTIPAGIGCPVQIPFFISYKTGKGFPSVRFSGKTVEHRYFASLGQLEYRPLVVGAAALRHTIEVAYFVGNQASIRATTIYAIRYRAEVVEHFFTVDRGLLRLRGKERGQQQSGDDRCDVCKSVMVSKTRAKINNCTLHDAPLLGVVILDLHGGTEKSLSAPSWMFQDNVIPELQRDLVTYRYGG